MNCVHISQMGQNTIKIVDEINEQIKCRLILIPSLQQLAEKMKVNNKWRSQQRAIIIHSKAQKKVRYGVHT